MKKNSISIKNNISMSDKVAAIRGIVSSYFTDGEYTPYYAAISETIAIVTYFIDGLEFEENESVYECSIRDDEVKELIDEFYTGNGRAKLTMDFVMKQVEDIVDFRKQTIIHSSTVDEERIIQKLDQILEKETRNKDAELKVLRETERLQKAQSKQVEYYNKVAEFMTPEETAHMNKTLMEQQLDPNELARIIADKYLQSDQHNRKIEEIISDKNAKIQELKKYKQMYDARNIIAEDKK